MDRRTSFAVVTLPTRPAPESSPYAAWLGLGTPPPADRRVGVDASHESG